MTFPYAKTVVLSMRVLLPAPDPYGNDQYTLQPVTLTPVVVWPTGATEQMQGQDLSTSGVTALLPAGTDVDAIDKLTIDGKDYEIDGQPASFLSPFSGFTPGVQVSLTRVTG